MVGQGEGGDAPTLRAVPEALVLAAGLDGRLHRLRAAAGVEDTAKVPHPLEQPLSVLGLNVRGEHQQVGEEQLFHLLVHHRLDPSLGIAQRHIPKAAAQVQVALAVLVKHIHPVPTHQRALISSPAEGVAAADDSVPILYASLHYLLMGRYIAPDSFNTLAMVSTMV